MRLSNMGLVGMGILTTLFKIVNKYFGIHFPQF
jgi:hypothetical protein